MPPPPKNLLKSSSGEISSSNIGPRPPGDRANPLKGEADEAEPAPNLLSGSPPNLSYFSFLSASDRTWKARETTVQESGFSTRSFEELEEELTFKSLVRAFISILVGMCQ